MANKSTIDIGIQKLAMSLVNGDRKDALSIIRTRLGEPFENEYLELVWKGWERALLRQEADALIFQLINGLDINEVRKIHLDLKKKKSEVLIRDHSQKELSKYYIDSWVDLLEIYSNNCKDKQ
ncbi:MAG: hypothetical protein FK734_09735 [Asgard group archaeon]|nr:hypothetical protein [Asgard group archaeon]